MAQNVVKKRGRPKKNIDYDSQYVMEFLSLFGSYVSWEDIIGCVIKYSELEERKIIDLYIEKDLHSKLKSVLPLNDFRKIANDKINNVNDMIDLLRGICKKKKLKLSCAFSKNGNKIILIEPTDCA